MISDTSMIMSILVQKWVVVFSLSYSISIFEHYNEKNMGSVVDAKLWINFYFIHFNQLFSFFTEYETIKNRLMSLFLSKTRHVNKDKEQLKLALMGEHCLALG